MQPIDYGVQIADPTQAFLGAFKTGAVIQEAGLKQQQQQQVLEQQKLIQAQFTKIRSPDATVEDVANLAMILPKDQSQALRDSFALRTDAQKQNTLNATGKIVSAFFAGENDIAANLIDQQATAKKNSGDVEGANFLTTFRDITNINPKASQEFFTAQLLQLPGGDKIVEKIIKLKGEQRTAQLQPAALKKAVADADAAVAEAITKQATATNAAEKAAADAAKAKADAEKAQVDADFARANAVLDAEKKRADITKTAEDILIAKEDNRIKALNAAAAKELNAVKRDEILQRREDATAKRDQAKRDQDSLLGNQLSSIDNFLNTAIRATNTPLDVREAATGTISSRFIPTLRDATVDYEGLIETLGAQAFLAQIPQIKGTGSLSENEGNKLQASLQNLSLKQSPERLQENINEAVRLLTKARENIVTRSGKAAAPPDTPASAQVTVVVNGQSYTFPNQAAADAAKKAAGIK